MVSSEALLNQDEIDYLTEMNLDNSIDYTGNLPKEFPWSLLNFIDISSHNLNLNNSSDFRNPQKQLNELICDVMIPEQRRVYDDLLENKLFSSLADHLNSVDFLSRDKLLKFRRRDYLDSHLSSLVSSNSNFSFLMLDLDKFSQVNNCYGHQVGDEVLSDLGDLIRDELRQSDVAYRYGGEEIGIVLPDTCIDGAYVVAEKLRKSIEDNLVIGFTENIKERNSYNLKNFDDLSVCVDSSITTSIGVSEFLVGEDLVSYVIGRADKALYESKNSGRNKVSVSRI